MNHSSSFKNKTLAFYYENYEKRNHFCWGSNPCYSRHNYTLKQSSHGGLGGKPCLFYLNAIKKRFFTVTGYFFVKVCFLWDICVYVSPK